jgi:hypothetical protein
MEYAQESFLDAMLRPGTGDRKVRTLRNCRRRWPNPVLLRRRERSGCMRACLKEARRPRFRGLVHRLHRTCAFLSNHSEGLDNRRPK